MALIRKKPKENTGGATPPKRPMINKDRLGKAYKKGGGRTFKIVAGLLTLIILVLAYISFISGQSDKDVEVLKLNSALPQGGTFDESNLIVAKMSEREFMRSGVVTSGDKKQQKRAILLAEDKDKILGKSAAHYIRENTPIYWDSIAEDVSRKYQYLYSMDGELAKVEIDVKDFGEMIVPGDRVNVRVVYQDEVYKLPTKEEIELQQTTGIQPKTTVEKQELLFNNVAVLDMLNSNKESIFDIYYDLMSRPKKEQQQIMAGDGFAEKIKPDTVLLNLTPEEVDHYMRIKNKGSNFMLTLLPRTSSNAITELINEITTGLAKNQQEIRSQSK